MRGANSPSMQLPASGWQAPIGDLLLSRTPAATAPRGRVLRALPRAPHGAQFSVAPIACGGSPTRAVLSQATLAFEGVTQGTELGIGDVVQIDQQMQPCHGEELRGVAQAGGARQLDE